MRSASVPFKSLPLRRWLGDGRTSGRRLVADTRDQKLLSATVCPRPYHAMASRNEMQQRDSGRAVPAYVLYGGLNMLA